MVEAGHAKAAAQGLGDAGREVLARADHQDQGIAIGMHRNPAAGSGFALLVSLGALGALRVERLAIPEALGPLGCFKPGKVRLEEGRVAWQREAQPCVAIAQVFEACGSYNAEVAVQEQFQHRFTAQADGFGLTAGRQAQFHALAAQGAQESIPDIQAPGGVGASQGHLGHEIRELAVVQAFQDAGLRDMGARDAVQLSVAAEFDHGLEGAPPVFQEEGEMATRLEVPLAAGDAGEGHDQPILLLGQ